MKIDIAGVLVDNVTVSEAIERIKLFVGSGKANYVVTPYSEFIVEAEKNTRYKEILNNADLSVPDGIGILWAAKFLSLPKRDPIITFLNWIGTLGSIVLDPNSIRSVIKEQVTGRKLIWDIANMAAANNFSLALVGGFDGVAEKSAEILKQKFPTIRINLAFTPDKFDDSLVEKISQSNSDILLIAYQPPRQEMWIAENLSKLNVKVAMGLGGTFDYLAGRRQPAPDLIHHLGLEWMWRLITQPWRIKRMWNAIVNFSILVLNYKFYGR